MDYKQLHVVWFMNLDTDSCCNFKTYPLEHSSKPMSQKQDAYLLSTKLHLPKIDNKDIHFIITIYKCFDIMPVTSQREWTQVPVTNYVYSPIPLKILYNSTGIGIFIFVYWYMIYFYIICVVKWEIWVNHLKRAGYPESSTIKNNVCLRNSG